MQTSEIMTASLYALQANDTIDHAASAMKIHDVGALPVCNGPAVTGIITDRDIVLGCVAADRQPHECVVGDYMTPNPVCISPETSAEEALDRMAHEQVRRLCVVDNGNLVGMVALGDFAHHFMDSARVAETLASISEPLSRGLWLG